jgi:type I restriction enzyme S subunit
MSAGATPDDWSEFRLGDLGESIIGLTYAPSNVKRSGTLVLRSSNVQNGRLAFDDNVYVDSTIPERIRVRNGDILICVRNGSRQLIGKSVRLDDRVTGQTFGAFMAVYRSDLNDFLQHFFQSSAFKRQIDAHLGATINQITNSSLNSFLVLLPSSPAERDAISKCLDDITSLTEVLERSIAKKQAMKKGMMEELLTGRTRLSGYSEMWTDVALGDISAVSMGQSPPGSSYNTVGRGIPLVQGNADIRSRRTIERIWTTSPTKRCSAGDVIVTVRAPVGYVAVASKDACIGRGVCAISSKRDSRYLYHALVYAEPRWSVYEQGSTFTAVNSHEVRSFGLPWPPNPAERSAIAATLDDADGELALLGKRLAKAKAIKEGVTQALLTGRTRLRVGEAAA